MKSLLAVPVIAIVLMAASPGTVKIDKDHTLPDNDPHVCALDVRSWMSDSADYTVRAWPPTGDKTVVLTGTTDSLETIALPNGHYKLETSTGKHKVFWVDCPTVEPTPVPKPTPVVTTTVVVPTPTPTPVADLLERPLPETDTVTTVDAGRAMLLAAGFLFFLILAVWALGERRR